MQAAILTPSTPACFFPAIFRPVWALSGHANGLPERVEIPLFRHMAERISAGQELVFILPAFPAKSANRQKTCGSLPDLGEVLALQALENMCQEISAVYAPGARIVICSDGRVFSDLVLVPDSDITAYAQKIDGIIGQFKLDHLTTFSMDDLLPGIGHQARRDYLINEYAMSPETVRARVRENQNDHQLFNGMHRFVQEDRLALMPELSKSRVCRESRLVTLELIRRSDAWSKLLEKQFPYALRLSIHPYPPGHEKFGVKLVRSSNRWATPWHNVVVKSGHDFHLMPHKEALALGARRQELQDEYAYFKL